MLSSAITGAALLCRQKNSARFKGGPHFTDIKAKSGHSALFITHALVCAAAPTNSAVGGTLLGSAGGTFCAHANLRHIIVQSTGDVMRVLNDILVFVLHVTCVHFAVLILSHSFSKIHLIDRSNLARTPPQQAFIMCELFGK